MPDVFFSHPVVDDLMNGPLKVTTGADEISWGYALNTQTFPTYGGEVVQILSRYISDFTIVGSLRTYSKMERVYKWFLSYIQIATQTGTDAISPFDQTPVSFSYPHRNWTLSLIPKSLPGFRYGRDLVVPQWRMEAAVIEGVESDRDINSRIITVLNDFGKVPADIGYQPDNPFSAPFTKDKNANADTQKAFGQLGDWFTSLIPAYQNGDFSGLHADYGSHPVFIQGGNGSSTDFTNSTAKK